MGQSVDLSRYEFHFRYGKFELLTLSVAASDNAIFNIRPFLSAVQISFVDGNRDAMSCV